MSDQTMVNEIAKPKLFEFKRLGYGLKFVVSGDGLTCTCIYDPNLTGPPLTENELRDFLAQSKIREGLDEDAIAGVLAKAEARSKVTDSVIARGIAMIPGEDGVLDMSELEGDQNDDDSEQVDMRNVQKFLNVSNGQLVGVILSPGEGTPGTSVFGKEIPAQRGEELKIQLGNQVRLGEDERSIYAETDGRVYYNKGEISVEDTYTVKGDIDFKVGNVDYNGFLDVRGDVLDGFSVKATKGIKLQGNIGKCTIESDGNIAFCGMASQDKGTIRCGGSISANFLHDTTIECDGDIIVETEIRNCTIKCLGLVRVNKGVLVGGNCIALGGVEVATAGSPSSVFTRIVVGVSYRDLDEHNSLFNELKKVLEEFKASKDRTNTDELMKQRAAITERIQEVRGRNYENANAKINVKKKLYEKVNITLAKISEEIKEELSGPLSIIVNTVEGGVRYLPMTDLSVKAGEIEQRYVQEAERMKQSCSE